MPAYGSQVVPDVPNAISALVPKADDTVPNLIGQMGNAGLAAFVSTMNHAGQLKLQEKELQQKAVLDQQHIGLEREKMAQDFQMQSRQLAQGPALIRLRAQLEHKDTVERDQQIAGYYTAQNNLTVAKGTPEYALAQAGIAGLYPRAFEDRYIAEHWGKNSNSHDQAVAVRQAASLFGAPTMITEGPLAGIQTPGIRPDYETRTDEAGNTTIIQKTPKAGRFAGGGATPPLYDSVGALLNENPNAKYRQDAKTGKFLVTGETAGSQKAPKNPLMSPAKDPVQINVGNLASDGAFEPDPRGDYVRVDTGQIGKDGKPVRNVMTKNEYLGRGGHLAPESMPGASTNPSPAPTPSVPGAYSGPTSSGIKLRAPNGEEAVFPMGDPRIEIAKAKGATVVQ